MYYKIFITIHIKLTLPKHNLICQQKWIIIKEPTIMVTLTLISISNCYTCMQTFLLLFQESVNVAPSLCRPIESQLVVIVDRF